MGMKSHGRRRAGTAILEFAIGSGMFLALFVGTFQFGYTFYLYNNLESAVRSAARFGSVLPYDVNRAMVNSDAPSTFLTAVRNVAVYGDPAGSASGNAPVASDLTTEHVSVDVNFVDGLPRTVTVSIRNYRIEAIFGNWTANGKPRASFTYTGRFAPPSS